MNTNTNTSALYTYDEIFHMYYLTESGIKTLLGYDIVAFLKKDESLTNFLRMVSETVYAWFPGNLEYLDYVMLKDKAMLMLFLKGLTYQAEYLLNNGAADTEAGIDWTSYSTLNANSFNRTISPRTIQLYKKYKLIYMGVR